MPGDIEPKKEEKKTEVQENAQKIEGDKQVPAQLNLVSLSQSDLLKSNSKAGLSVEGKQGIANFAGTISASITGTMAWSILDKTLGSTRYGLAAKLAGTVVVGGVTRFAGKGATEMALLDAKDRTTGLKDLAWGGVDALAAVGAVKAEEAFSKSWKIGLGRSSGAHLSQEMMLDQGRKILEGDLSKRIVHNTLRGVVGGGTGALLFSTPHEFANNFNKLNTLEGWKKTTDDIAKQTLFGGAFGGVLFGGGTALWNARELAGMAKASVLGKQGRYSLDIYHFNDGHSSVLGERSTLPQLASKADEVRKASQKAGVSSLVLDMGDAHSGNAAAIVSNTGQLEQKLIHQHVKVNYSIPGNHSADTGIYGGPKDVRQWMTNMNELNRDLQAAGREVPGLGANVQSVLDPKFTSATGIYKPYNVFVDPKTGDKVGIVGIVTEQLQTATPKLVDMELAQAASKYGNFTYKQVTELAATDATTQTMLQKLGGNGTLQQLVKASPDAKLSVLVEQVLQQQQLKGLSAEAQQSYRTWFALAGEHPQSTLGELAVQNTGNKNLAELAALYPQKRISDLHEVMVSDPLKALQDSVKALNAQGVDKVVVMSHLGKQLDMQLAREGPRVAAFFGGHSHHLEPVPVFVKNAATGSDVMVGQAGNSYGWLGEAKLVFNKDGSVNRFLSSGKMHVIDETVPAMKSAQEQVISHMKQSEEGLKLLDQNGFKHPVKVATEVPLDHIRGQMGTQTPLANLLTAAFKEGGDQVLPGIHQSRRMLGQTPLELGNSIDAVLIQSGGIRAGLPAGNVDELAVRTMFMNQPTIVSMSGEQIQKALSYGVHDMPAATRPQGAMAKIMDSISSFGRKTPPLAEFDASGKNLIVGELRYQIDRSLPAYERAQAVEIFNKELGKYVPIDPKQNYTVMTVTHLVKRFGGTPMMPNSQLRNLSTESLGPEYWVLGAPIKPEAASAALKAYDLPGTTNRDFLLNYLTGKSVDGKFAMPSAFMQSPMRDVSPGSWVPSLSPSWSATAIGATSANEALKK